MLDLLVSNATLPDGRTGMSLAVQDGRIVELAAGLQAAAHDTLDAQGLLLSPPFVDAHFHMDATLSYGMPRVNQSGTLLEGIALWGELKPSLTQDAVIERALAYCDWAVARGLLAIRSHVTPATRACSPSRRCWKCGAASRPTSTCSWWPFRRTACCAHPVASRTCSARWIWA